MEPPKFGTLVVVVDKARNLPNRKKIGKQDAYAIVRLGHEVQRTPTDKRAGQVPNWNHEIRFRVPSENENILKISVFNEDSKTPDLIGDCAIDLTDLYKKHEYDNWFDLKYKEKPAGELYAELTFYYEGPPKPKPKVELPDQLFHQGPSRPLSSAAFTRQLPTVPSASAIFAPMRRKTMSPDGRELLSMGEHTDESSLSLQNRNHIGAYAHQPATSHLDKVPATSQYAETWDGQRDTRVYQLPPGDMRRKSFSSETQRPLHDNRGLDQSLAALQIHNDQPRRRVMGPRENQSADRLSTSIQSHQQSRHPLKSRSQPVRSMTLDDHGYEIPASYHAAASFPDLVDDRYAETMKEQIVDSVLDPRHGSARELRDSPQIVSDSSLSNDVQNRYLNYESAGKNLYLDHSAMDLHCAQLQIHNVQRYDQPSGRRRECATPFHDTTDRGASLTYRHGQAHSMSHSSIPYGEQIRRQSLQHNKAASTSIARPTMDYDQRIPVQPFTTNNTLESRTRSDQLYAANQQNPATYAITPAQHHARERPLPRGPYSPPTLPAKIPLGLTQAEYDILYA